MKNLKIHIQIFSASLAFSLLLGCGERDDKHSHNLAQLSAVGSSSPNSSGSPGSMMEDELLTSKEVAAISSDLPSTAEKDLPKKIRDVIALLPLEDIASAEVTETKLGSEVTFYDENGERVEIPKVFVGKKTEGAEALGIVLLKLNTRAKRISITLLIDKQNKNSLSGLKGTGFFTFSLETLKVNGSTLEVKGAKIDKTTGIAVISRDENGAIEVSEKE